ncbi:MAG: tRNA-dihydrouridine synthase [Candidatus Pacebacteria bacterium]|nr:tRNA-dihydrouridine synthase [Candidatus Paceibacterota bacterium]
MSFWQNLKKPIFLLAPMADVTDAAYRKLIAETAKPDVTWTEFVSADGLYHTRELKKMPDDENPLMRDLQFTEAEHPIVAQLFSSKPEMMEYAAELCAKLGFDGVDINMGCPDKSIEKQGSGAAMIKTPEVARAVYEAARRGASRSSPDAANPIPVSLKTRIGYNRESIDEWITTLLELKPPVLTVHLRTRKEMSKVAAHWDLMPGIVALRDRISPETLIIGNGDVKDLEDAKQKIAESGADGVMFGRAIFGNPWLFSGRAEEDIIVGERLNALATLARYFEHITPPKSFSIFKKHIKAFVTGFDNAAELRAALFEAENADQVTDVINRSGLV